MPCICALLYCKYAVVVAVHTIEDAISNDIPFKNRIHITNLSKLSTSYQSNEYLRWIFENFVAFFLCLPGNMCPVFRFAHFIHGEQVSSYFLKQLIENRLKYLCFLYFHKFASQPTETVEQFACVHTIQH